MRNIPKTKGQNRQSKGGNMHEKANGKIEGVQESRKKSARKWDEKWEKRKGGKGIGKYKKKEKHAKINLANFLNQEKRKN